MQGFSLSFSATATVSNAAKIPIRLSPKPDMAPCLTKIGPPGASGCGHRFAKGGGTVVVSGNVRMLDQPHELAALGQFTVLIFERKWNQWDFHRKTSLLLFNWPLVLAS